MGMGWGRGRDGDGDGDGDGREDGGWRWDGVEYGDGDGDDDGGHGHGDSDGHGDGHGNGDDDGDGDMFVQLCDCANGGDEVSINRAEKDNFRTALRLANNNETSFLCTEMGRHIPCGRGSNTCVNQKCVFTLDDGSTTTTPAPSNTAASLAIPTLITMLLLALVH